MTPSLKIKSPSTKTVVSIPRGTDITLQAWGFPPIDARYTKKGKVVVYTRKTALKSGKRHWTNVPRHVFPSARSFINNWNRDVIIENYNGISEYWDINIYIKGENK